MGVRHDQIYTHIHAGRAVNPVSYRHTIIHWCSGYPQYLSTNMKYMRDRNLPGAAVILRDQAEDLTSQGMTKYPNTSKSGMGEHC